MILARVHFKCMHACDMYLILLKVNVKITCFGDKCYLNN